MPNVMPKKIQKGQEQLFKSNKMQKKNTSFFSLYKVPRSRNSSI